MASIFIVNMQEIGGVVELFNHENVKDKISFLPDFNKKEDLIILFIIPLSVQWWSSWYPGAEPGGGGYIAQRMLASKNEVLEGLEQLRLINEDIVIKTFKIDSDVLSVDTIDNLIEARAKIK